MPKLTVSMTDRHGDMLGAAFNRRIDKFLAQEKAARRAAAQAATAESRRVWNARPNKRSADGLGAFLNRETTGGRMASFVQWQAGEGVVRLNIARLDKSAPHWIIQEIGTGERATLRVGGQANPKGRPGKGATYVRTVRSQVGRRIPHGLVFATNGQYSPPGAKRNEQIQLASRVRGVPPRVARIRIRNEIQGQHFVQRGGKEGFHQYQTSVLAAARQTFRKSVKP